MYSLYRDGDILSVRKVPALFREDALTEAATGARQVKAPRVSFSQWREFTGKGRINGPKPDDVLLASWNRCREMGVEFEPTSCRHFTSMSEIEPFAAEAGELCQDIESDIYTFINRRRLLFAVVDPYGRIARSCGDIEALRNTHKLNFGPGAYWTEVSVGTNAIGTALATGQPTQVFGEEHYCRSHHVWSCTAVPVFSPKGDIWGCIDISGPKDADHSNSFGLLYYAAREMEKRLAGIHLQQLDRTFRSLLTTMFNSVMTGMLSVDIRGRIISANNEAELLLGSPGIGLRGRQADHFFDYDSFLARQKQNNTWGDPVQVHCHVNPDLIIRAAPLFTHDGTWTETVVSVSEPQRIRTGGRVIAAKPILEAVPGFDHVLYESTAMSRAVNRAANVARTPSTVLLTGESGTGKELFAKGIHRSGPRADGPFVAVNCGALSEELIQSELFGYSGGAFTGADRKGRIGKFEQAGKGVLFLDEISEMPLTMQVNLLRALEERVVVRVGGAKPRPVDVKVIAATNRDLRELVAQGRFREDLFYRINVVGIHIPPLRERGDDVRLLAEFHAGRLCSDFSLEYSGMEDDVLAVLARHDWPGNVRELVNCVEYAVNGMSDGVIRTKDLPPYLVPEQPLSETAATCGDAKPMDIRPGDFRLREVEAETIREALRFHQGNISRTARALGIGRNTLYAKMEKLNIAV